MVLNCAKVISEYGETVGFLAISKLTGNIDPLSDKWVFYDNQQYAALLAADPYGEAYLFLNDFEIGDYVVRRILTPPATDMSYSYLCVEEVLLCKATHRSDAALMVVQALYSRKRKYSAMVTIISDNAAAFSELVNQTHPTLKQSMYDVTGNVFRCVVPEHVLLSPEFYDSKFYSFISTMCIMEQLEKPHWSIVGKKLKVAEREYCKDLMQKLDSITDKYVLPDLSDYNNLLSYQTLMGYTSEQMALALISLETLYNTSDLKELDKCVARYV